MMKRVGQPIDILIFVEHVARELDVACAVKCLLEQHHGVTAEIASIAWDLTRTLRRFEPDVICLPYCYSAHDPGISEVLSVWPGAAYVNLAYEQVYQRINQAFKAPRDRFARHHVLHLAWGEFYAAYLRTYGVPESQVIVTGSPILALYQPPYRDYFDPKTSLAVRYGLDPHRRWMFVPENYGAAFYSDRLLKDYIRRGYDTAEAHRYRQFARDSFREAVQWWQQAAKTESVDVIVRPRPATPLSAFRGACQRILGKRETVRFRIIKEGTIREWILASDLVVSSYSTSLIEAAIARKPVAMLVPIPLPEFLHAEWYQFVPQVERASTFMDLTTNGLFESSSERLKGWATDRMLGVGDPLVNLVDLLASVCRRTRTIPPLLDQDRATHHGKFFRGIVRVLGAPRRYWRRRNQLRLHERDRILADEAACRVRKWSTIVDERVNGTGSGTCQTERLYSQ